MKDEIPSGPSPFAIKDIGNRQLFPSPGDPELSLLRSQKRNPQNEGIPAPFPQETLPNAKPYFITQVSNWLLRALLSMKEQAGIII